MEILQKILKCNCSICKRRNAVMSMVKNEDFKIIKGEDKLNFINSFKNSQTLFLY